MGEDCEWRSRCWSWRRQQRAPTTTIRPTRRARTTVAAAATSTSPPTTSATTTVPATVPATTSPATVPPTAPPTAPPTTEPPGPQWTETPVEGARLLRRQPLTIYERVADPTKVVLYFEGGGACFSARHATPTSPTYTVNRNGVTTSTLGRLGGYFDVQHGEPARHPFVRVRAVLHRRRARGQHHQDYGNGVVIEHRGYANATKALDYLVAQYPDAEQVVVTGESAGSVPTALFGALVADRLPDAGVVTFGDSSRRLPRRRSDQRRHRRGVGLPRTRLARARRADGRTVELPRAVHLLRPSRANACGSDASTMPSTRCRRSTARWPAFPATSW